MRLTRYVRDLGRDTRFAVRQLVARPGFAALADSDPRARDRRDDRHLQRGPCRRASSASAAATRADRCRLRGLQRAPPETSPQATSSTRRPRRRRSRRMTAIQYSSFNLSLAGTAERVIGARTTAAFFTVFGVRPAFGRAYTASEDQPGSRAGRRPEPSALDATLRCRSCDRRSGRPVGRTALSCHRRDAGLVRSECGHGRTVGADRVHGRAQGHARRALPDRLRAIEAGDLDRAGPR